MLKGFDDEQVLNFAFIGNYTKGMAHNVNTPLSAIMGRSEMLLMRFNRIKDKVASHMDVEELDKCLRDISLIIENSNRVSDTIKNTMQKSINAEGTQAHSLNIARVLREELEFFKADMDFKHNIEKKYNISNKTPSILGVYVHFSNSFTEILENSIQAMINTEEKRLTVDVKPTDKSIEVTFHDTGCGIEEEKTEKIMQILQSPPLDLTDVNPSYRGISRIGRLLKPYNVQFDIRSRPGDTFFSIKIPV